MALGNPDRPNNSILIVEFVEQLRERGHSILEAAGAHPAASHPDDAADVHPRRHAAGRHECVAPDMGNLTVPPSGERPHARCVHGAAGLGYGAGGWRLTPNGRGRSACVVNGRLRHTVEGAVRRASPRVVSRVGFCVLQTSSERAAALPLSFLQYSFQRFHAERLKGGVLVEGELSQLPV